MGRPRKHYARVGGPYYSGGRWRVVVRAPDGTAESTTFASQAEADAFAAEYRATLGAGEVLSFLKAREEYERYLTEKGNKPNSIIITMIRLSRFFDGLDDEPVPGLSPRRAAALYRKLVDADLSADSHRNYLAEAKTFYRWAVKRGFAGMNPLEGVEGVGKRRRGKEQLRVDELRVLSAHCLRLATDPGVYDWRASGARAVLVALYLGLRASEVVGLQVRDLDNGGRLLWVAAKGGKTQAARRLVEVPELLRPLLLAQAGTRDRDAYLFAGEKGPHKPAWIRQTAQRECLKIKLPAITAHSLRGAVATIAANAGVVGQLVADHLGHESYRQTEAAYAAPGSVDAGRRAKGVALLAEAKSICSVSVPEADDADG